MPMHRIFHTPGTFSEHDKQELAQRITGFYETLGLPNFNVIVLFVPLEERDFYVGGKPNVGGKFVRILVDHIARDLSFNLQVVRFFKGYEATLAPFIKDRGLDWEVTVTASEANLWRENGLIPTLPTSNRMNKDGTEEQKGDEPLAKKAKLDEDKVINGVDICRRKTVFLAVEIWTDILGFLKRIQLAGISLTNLRIHQICWPRLHGNKVALVEDEDEEYYIGPITIIGQQRFDQGRPPKAIVLKDDKAMSMPSCPLPSYISGFYQINIKFLDQQVFEFFTHILPCLAKNGVLIFFNFDGLRAKQWDAKQCALLDQLLNKFKDGMEEDQLRGFYRPMPMRIQYLPDINNKLPVINLHLEQASAIPTLLQMLASPRPDGRQRVIHVPGRIQPYLAPRLIPAIKEDFRSATQRLPQPFYICFYRGDYLDFQQSVETNEQTDEQLTIMPRPTTDDDIRIPWEICRHPRGQHEQWASEGRKRASASFGRGYTQIHVDLK